ncbi:MAG TPA: DUF3465 domain-containing protein [Methylovorus sp.]|jgi:hypothetical protein|nr:DUF3465 domain-containing protein [Methylovorus sp.]
MKRLILAAGIALAYTVWHFSQAATAVAPVATPVELARPATWEDGDAVIQQAFDHRLSHVQVKARGHVVKVLKDDNDGTRHQRILLRLQNGITVLIAHNIDLAPRIPALAVGDELAFQGEYVWNAKGGVVHWTHHDPQQRHTPGWLEYQGNTYQ